MKVTFLASLDKLHEMLQFIQTQALAVGFNATEATRVEVALEEALVNVINYAYPGKAGGTIEIEFNKLSSSAAVQMIVKDHGLPFDPIHSGPKIRSDIPVENKPIGGYGIYLIRQIMDEVEYRREGDANILTLTKRLMV